MSDDDLIRRGDISAWMTKFGFGGTEMSAAIAAIPAIHHEPVTVEVKPLVWDADGRKLSMVSSMAFSKSYDLDGYDCLRKEGYGLGMSYIIWPDSIISNKWNVYGTSDGLFIPDIAGEDAAKSAAQADYERSTLHVITARPAAEVRAKGWSAAIEAAAQAIETQGDSVATEALGQQICCNGQMCGCQGATVEDWLLHQIRSTTPPANIATLLAAHDTRIRSEELAKVIEEAGDGLMAKHTTYMVSKGRNLGDYTSQFSLAADAIDAMHTPESRAIAESSEK